MLLVSEPSRSQLEVAPAAIISADALRELDQVSTDANTIGDTIGDTIDALAESGANVVNRALIGCWCYIGDPEHLLEANPMILDELPHSAPEGELGNVRIEGRVAIHPSARLEMATVRGPAVIGGGAELVDSSLARTRRLAPMPAWRAPRSTIRSSSIRRSSATRVTASKRV
jgi:NDP-sugar pyrophosphorylase family protein